MGTHSFTTYVNGSYSLKAVRRVFAEEIETDHAHHEDAIVGVPARTMVGDLTSGPLGAAGSVTGIGGSMFLGLAAS